VSSQDRRIDGATSIVDGNTVADFHNYMPVLFDTLLRSSQLTLELTVLSRFHVDKHQSLTGCNS
jgi:hypothetical protein